MVFSTSDIIGRFKIKQTCVQNTNWDYPNWKYSDRIDILVVLEEFFIFEDIKRRILLFRDGNEEKRSTE